MSTKTHLKIRPILGVRVKTARLGKGGKISKKIPLSAKPGVWVPKKKKKKKGSKQLLTFNIWLPSSAASSRDR